MQPLSVSDIESGRNEACIVGRTNQKLDCPITDRQSATALSDCDFSKCVDGRCRVIFGNRQGASDAPGSITDLRNMGYIIREEIAQNRGQVGACTSSLDARLNVACARACGKPKLWFSAVPPH